MKVILRTEVDKLGSFGDVVKVAPGYARNFLIPKGFASLATPGNIRQLETEKEAFAKKAQVRREKAEGRKAQIEALSLSFTRKASEEDRLFGSVSLHDIEEALKANGFEFEKKDINLAEPIRSFGQFTVEVKLHPQVFANVNVTVSKEE